MSGGEQNHRKPSSGLTAPNQNPQSALVVASHYLNCSVVLAGQKAYKCKNCIGRGKDIDTSALLRLSRENSLSSTGKPNFDYPDCDLSTLVNQGQLARGKFSEISTEQRKNGVQMHLSAIQTASLSHSHPVENCGRGFFIPASMKKASPNDLCHAKFIAASVGAKME